MRCLTGAPSPCGSCAPHAQGRSARFWRAFRRLAPARLRATRRAFMCVSVVCMLAQRPPFPWAGRCRWPGVILTHRSRPHAVGKLDRELHSGRAANRRRCRPRRALRGLRARVCLATCVVAWIHGACACVLPVWSHKRPGGGEQLSLDVRDRGLEVYPLLLDARSYEPDMYDLVNDLEVLACLFRACNTPSQIALMPAGAAGGRHGSTGFPALRPKWTRCGCSSLCPECCVPLTQRIGMVRRRCNLPSTAQARC